MDASYIKARDIMREPLIIDPNRSVREAAEIILNHGVGALVVVENEKPIGVVTKRDLLWFLTYSSRDPGVESVARIMTKNLISVDPDADITTVIEKMLSNNISHIVVIEDDRLVGIISDREIIELFQDMLEYEKSIVK